MKTINRRQFLHAAAGTIGATAMLGSTASVRGANGDVRVVVIGLGSKGPQHAQVFAGLPGVKLLGLCDVDRQRLDEHTAKLSETTGPLEKFTDPRAVLDRKDVDAVVVAAPNHWHALMTIWACQAGKDVYCEKPLAYSVWEGRQMIAAARKYNRIVQHGTQMRSDPGTVELHQWLNEGHLGAVKMARIIFYRRRESMGRVNGPQPVPASVDYDLWTGPARMQPLMRSRLHYDWHWDWNTGNGELANNGVHFLDNARQILGDPPCPQKVISIGGRFGYDDDGQTPNTQLIYYESEVPVLMEIRGLPTEPGSRNMDRYEGLHYGLRIECEGGHFSGYRGGWAYDADGERIRQFIGDGGAGHQANFIKAVQSRKIEDLHADVALGHDSTLWCHLGNISWLCGQPAPVAHIQREIGSIEPLSDAFDRMAWHLRPHDVNLDQTQATLGTPMHFDVQRQAFVGEPGNTIALANNLLCHRGRENFIIPQLT